jgi:hypothetical protein
MGVLDDLAGLAPLVFVGAGATKMVEKVSGKTKRKTSKRKTTRRRK